MAYIFPSDAWLQAFENRLNSDEKYAKVARKWEGDFVFQIDPEGPLTETAYFYLDLWHGKCRDSFLLSESQLTEFNPAYVLSAPYTNFTRVLKGDLDPMQAMITRKLSVKGSMAYLMRNLPVVLNFVRCAQEVDTEFLK